MKKVFTNSWDVLHLFAQQTQNEACCNNVFFENNRIYSYGRHYLLAEFINNKKGENAILINDTGYSVTTLKHIQQIRQATRQYKQFFEMQTNPAKVLMQLENYAHKLQSARKKELYINPALYLIDKYNEFQNWFGKTNDKVNDKVDDKKIKEISNVFSGQNYSEYLKKQADRIKKEQAKKARQEKIRLASDIKKFLNYEINRIYSSSVDFLRISENKEFVETSQNVKIPVKAAKTLYLLIKAGKDIKGYNIEGFTVISINGVLKVGCHNIDKLNMTETGEKLLSLDC